MVQGQGVDAAPEEGTNNSGLHSFNTDLPAQQRLCLTLRVFTFCLPATMRSAVGAALCSTETRCHISAAWLGSSFCCR